MKFEELHQQESPLLICNVWDVASTKTAEKLDFKAIGTSSAAIATSLGYDDGENMSFDELYYVVKRIIANTSLPLTVDIEAGYSRATSKIVAHVISLAELGVVGINIEDSIVESKRYLVNKDVFSMLIKAIDNELKNKNKEVFLNIRTDTFLLGIDNALQESIERIKLYSQAGANGIFLPCITAESDISMVVEHSNLPINVMCMPELPNFNRLKALGVKRISMGNFIFDHLMTNLDSVLSDIIEQQTFESLF
jgi:2-methylisocitrate lyase-like PEP mutase family enzyme